MEDQRIKDLKKQIQDLYDKKSKCKNEVIKLDIDWEVSKLKVKIEDIEKEIKQSSLKTQVQQPKVEVKKEEKKEEVKSEEAPDLNRGKVAEPGSTIPDNHKKEDKKEYNKNDNKKN